MNDVIESPFQKKSGPEPDPPIYKNPAELFRRDNVDNTTTATATELNSASS
jgi:hypothetical protein